MISLHDNFFTELECKTAVDEINQNSSLWYKCNETEMYILGNSLLRNLNNHYLDKNNYNFNTVSMFREKLLNIFPKVEFCKKLAKPGFQIIKKNETCNPCVWHYDSILLCFPFQTEFSDYNNNFREYFDKYYIFTLMLSNSPSSFDYYPETSSNFGITRDVETQSPETPICKNHVDLIGDNCDNPQCQLKNFQTISYTQGSLLIQTERTLHRVGYRDVDGTSTSRIALQSYGLVKDGIMYLCW
jgi:hypothetical protein